MMGIRPMLTELFKFPRKISLERNKEELVRLIYVFIEAYV